MSSTGENEVLSIAAKYNLSKVALTQSDIEKIASSSSSNNSYSDDEISDDNSTIEKPLRSPTHSKRSNKQSAKGRQKHAHDSDILLDSNSSLDSSGMYGSSEDTLHLSLPDSFDDTLHFEVPQQQQQQLKQNKPSHSHSHSHSHSLSRPNFSNNSNKTDLLNYINELEATMSKQRYSHQDEISSLTDRFKQEKQQYQAHTSDSSRELKLMQQRLQDKKELFLDLAISDTLFEELGKLPESQLTLKEFVAVKVYKSTSQYKRDAVSCRKKLEEVSERAKQAL